MRSIRLAIMLCLVMIASIRSYLVPQGTPQAPSSVWLQLERLRVVDAQEEGCHPWPFCSNGDEPYVAAIAFRSRFKTQASTWAGWGEHLAELGHVESGGEVDVPAEMGLVSFPDVQLVTLDDIAAGRRFPEVIGALVIAMESDATPFAQIRDKINDLKAALEAELRRMIENGELDLENLRQDTLAQAVDRVKASTAVSFWEGLGLWLSSFTDPDDQIAYHLYMYVTVDDELSHYVPAIQQPDITFGPLANQRYEIGANPVVFAGDGALYEGRLTVSSTATTQPAAIDCVQSYQSFTRRFLPLVRSGVGNANTPQIVAQLDVVQYNVQFLTPWEGSELPGHKPNTTERASAIGQALAGYDIVALNETVNDARRNEIVQAMNLHAPDYQKPKLLSGSSYFAVATGPTIDEPQLSSVGDALNAIANHRGAPIVGDELTIVSRLPIAEADSYIYQAHAGVDRLAAKGILHARLYNPELSAPAYLDVFATHLQAGDYGEVRRCQVAELANYIHMHARPNTPIIVLGDFNIDGGNNAQVDPSSLYTYMMNTFLLKSGYTLQDVGRDLDRGTDLSAAESQAGRIDYIFIAPTGLTVDPAAVHIHRFDDDRWGTLSDHAAVDASMLWAR